ncbi:MAG TPA: hypothetical protein VFC63_28820 [Blastocatellia bacterium]|nr:hypothetical protein [Blastocatellia bacterium]
MSPMKVTILTPEKFLDKAKSIADKLKPAYQAVVKLEDETPSRSDVILRVTRDGRILPLADRTGRLVLYLQIESAVALKQLGVGAQG